MSISMRRRHPPPPPPPRRSRFRFSHRSASTAAAAAPPPSSPPSPPSLQPAAALLEAAAKESNDDRFSVMARSIFHRVTRRARRRATTTATASSTSTSTSSSRSASLLSETPTSSPPPPPPPPPTPRRQRKLSTSSISKPTLTTLPAHELISSSSSSYLHADDTKITKTAENPRPPRPRRHRRPSTIPEEGEDLVSPSPAESSRLRSRRDGLVSSSSSSLLTDDHSLQGELHHDDDSCYRPSPSQDLYPPLSLDTHSLNGVTTTTSLGTHPYISSMSSISSNGETLTSSIRRGAERHGAAPPPVGRYGYMSRSRLGNSRSFDGDFSGRYDFHGRETATGNENGNGEGKGNEKWKDKGKGKEVLGREEEKRFGSDDDDNVLTVYPYSSRKAERRLAPVVPDRSPLRTTQSVDRFNLGRRGRRGGLEREVDRADSATGWYLSQLV